jgi:hypothetical protein
MFAGYVRKYAPNPNKKLPDPAADSARANVESNSVQAQPAPECVDTDGKDKKQGEGSDSDDMSGLLSDSDEE